MNLLDGFKDSNWLAVITMHEGKDMSLDQYVWVRKRVFCWLPTMVHSSRYWRDGFRWFSFVYLDDDGKYYTTPDKV